MFICGNCGISSLPKVSPVLVPVETRNVEYTNYDSLGEIVRSVGTEIIREQKLCPGCSGIPVKVESEPDFTPLILATKGYHSHTRGCSGKKPVKDRDGNKIGEVDCKVCVRVGEAFFSMPLQGLSKALEDPLNFPMRTSLAALCVENMLTRSNDRSKRGKRDFEAAYPLLKEYEQRGGAI